MFPAGPAILAAAPGGSKGLRVLLAGILLAVAALTGTASSCRAGKAAVRIVTEEFKPMSFMHDGEVRGYAAECVAAALREAGIPFSMDVLPWTRAYDLALKDPDVFIFSMVRTPERERHFIWIQALTPARVRLFRPVERTDLAGVQSERLPEYRFATLRGYFTEGLLARWGVSPSKIALFPEHRKDDLFRHLELGRSDFYLGDPLTFDYDVRESGKIGRFVPEGEAVRVSDYYFAANPETDPEVLAQVRDALSRFFAAGRDKPFRIRYLDAFEP